MNTVRPIRIPTQLRVLMTVAILGCHASLLEASPGRAKGPCAAATPVANLVGVGEPGEPLHVTGRVFRPDGVTPAAGVILYVYHTDAKGHYNRFLKAGPRLRGWIKTDSEGRYEYRTVKPAPYPGRRFAAHVHTQLWEKDGPPQYNTDLLFEGDPLISDAERRASAQLGRFAFISPLRLDERRVWRAVHDIRLKEKGDRFEDNTLHGLRSCGVAS